jgi:hypothetical protein
MGWRRNGRISGSDVMVRSIELKADPTEEDATMRQITISALVIAALTTIASTYALEQSQINAAAPSLHELSVHPIYDGRLMRLDRLSLLVS